MDMECGGSVLVDDNEIFALLGKLREFRAGKKLGFAAYGILRSELVDAGCGFERAVNPDIWLDGLADVRCNSAESLDAAVRIDNGELGSDGEIGHIGVLVVLRTEPGLVQADGTPVVNVQGIEVAALAIFASAVDFGKACC